MNIINIEHISKIFGEKVIFEDASFGIQQGDKIGIVGINGTGKSTLLRMIAGEEEPDQGQIILQNGLKIAYLPQNPFFPEGATVASYALSGNGDKDWLVQSNMTKLGIEVSEQEVENLSGGQRRKLALAKVLAGDFDVLLLDEPTNHLDEGMINWLEDPSAVPVPVRADADILPRFPHDAPIGGNPVESLDGLDDAEV